jgi:AraC family transcriptional regulator
MDIQPYARGRYAGDNKGELPLGGVLLSQTVYAANTVSDWHFHEHPYFALILQGGSTEVRKTGSLECLPGQAYFYNWEDVHRNKDYQEGSRNFNLEFDRSWFDGLPIERGKLMGITLLRKPADHLLLVKLFREYLLWKRSADLREEGVEGTADLSIQTLALELVSRMAQAEDLVRLPSWVRQVEELLNDRWAENVSLSELSSVTGVHAVHISRYFPKYIGCSFGEYIRKLRITRSLPMVRSTRKSLTAIAYECGFADQSHFTRTFRQLTHFSPGAFRRS